MKSKNSYIERRRHPRIDKHLQFKLMAEDFDIATETMNLSRNGVYCQINKNIPLLTNLKVFLALPQNDEDNEFEYVECNGVVVRVEKNQSGSNTDDSYNVAIYFNKITDIDKEKLESFFQKTTA
jgi:hypothetical protein